MSVLKHQKSANMQPCSPSPSKNRQTPLSPPQTGPSKTSSFFSFFTPSKSFGRLSQAAQASPSRSIKLASVIMQAAANSAGGIAAGDPSPSRDTSDFETYFLCSYLWNQAKFSRPYLAWMALSATN
jgi:hypothetical protein